jgi:hypothetical protein
VLFAPTQILPPTVVTEIRALSCAAPERIPLEAPHLHVTARVVGRALNIHLQYLSAVGTSADPAAVNALRTYIGIDETGILLSLPPGGDLEFTVPRVARGIT